MSLQDGSTGFYTINSLHDKKINANYKCSEDVMRGNWIYKDFVVVAGDWRIISIVKIQRNLKASLF